MNWKREEGATLLKNYFSENRNFVILNFNNHIIKT